MLIALICFLICGIVFPSLLEYIHIPDIRLKGEMDNYFLLKPLLNFILEAVEKVKMPLLTLALVIFSEQTMTVNLGLTAMVMATAFPWQKKFQHYDNSMNMAVASLFLSLQHFLLIPVLYGILFWRQKKPPVNLLIIFLLSFALSLWNDDYYLATAVMLIMSLFRQEQLPAENPEK